MLQYSYLSLPYHQWVVDIHIAENIVLNNVGDSDLTLRKIKFKKKTVSVYLKNRYEFCPLIMCPWKFSSKS